MKIRRSLLKTLVTIHTRTGDGAVGPVYADPVTIRAGVDTTRRLVRNPAGEQVITDLTIISHPKPRNEATQAVLDARDLFTPNSKVTVSGRTASVLGVSEQVLRGNPVFLKVVTI